MKVVIVSASVLRIASLPINEIVNGDSIVGQIDEAVGLCSIPATQVDVLVYLTALDHMAEVMAAVAAGDQVNLLVMRHQVLEVGAALLELYGAKEHLFHTGLLEEYGTVTYATNLKDNHEKIYSNKR